AFWPAKASASRYSGDKYGRLRKPCSGSSSASGYTGWTSKPPIPPSRMTRISRSSSGLVTAEPNHHQRIMILASSGGCSKPRRRSARSSARAEIAHAARDASRIRRRQRKNVSVSRFLGGLDPSRDLFRLRPGLCKENLFGRGIYAEVRQGPRLGAATIED